MAAVAAMVVALTGCGPATAESSGFTEALAFEGRTRQPADELQHRLNALHESFRIEPGKEADRDTQWLLLNLSGGWVSVDGLLDCMEERLAAEEPEPEMVEYATGCVEDLQREYDEMFPDG